MTNKFKSLFYITLLSAAVLAGCTPEEGAIAPNFPKAETYLIEDLEEDNPVVISISPNQAWTVSIPTSALDYFAIQDGTQRGSSTGGRAGDHEIEIVCLATERDLEEHSVDVTMQMGGQTQIIATVILTGTDPVIEIKSADIAEDSDGNRYFEELDGDFDHKYSGKNLMDEEGKTSGIEMLWSAAENGYVSYIQVDANFSWAAGELGNFKITRINTSGRVMELKISTSELNQETESGQDYLAAGTVGKVYSITVDNTGKYGPLTSVQADTKTVVKNQDITIEAGEHTVDGTSISIPLTISGSGAKSVVYYNFPTADYDYKYQNNVENIVAGVALDYGNTSFLNVSEISSLSNNTLTIDGLSPNKEYLFVIFAIDEDGNVTEDYATFTYTSGSAE